MGNKRISNTFAVNTVEDGVSQPSYIETQEAWSNVASVTSASTEPTPNSGWYDYTPSKGNYTYLWRRSRARTFNELTRTYTAGNWTYTRLTGENGTSISIKGHVSTVANLPSTHSDGDAYVVDANGHLYMWSSEANSWVDIGVFQGENGETYYTHIAWATSVTLISNPTTKKNASSVNGFTIVANENCEWMGVLVDKSVEDSTTATDYTWSHTKGNDGDDGVTYLIEASNGSVTIGADQTIATYTTNLAFYSKQGNKARQSLSAYCTIYKKKGTTYTVARQYTTAAASIQSVSISNVTTTEYDAIVICIYALASTAHSNYLWELEIPVRKNGDTGAAGGNTAIISLYRRSLRALTDDDKPKTQITYNFASKAITSPSMPTNGWYATITSGNDPIYVTAATAYGNGNTDTIAANEWSTPVLLVENGAAGLNSATVTLYQRSTSAPAKPTSSITYTFASGSVQGNLNGWSVNIPSNASGQHLPCWVIQATAISASATDTIGQDEWSEQAKLVEDGVSVSEKTEIRYAISSATTTSSATTSPAIIGTWSTSMPSPTAAAPYIWVRSQYYTYNGETWALQATTYSRLTGESGTGVAISGSAIVKADIYSTRIPANGTSGMIIIVQGYATPFIYDGGAWVSLSIAQTNDIIIVRATSTPYKWNGTQWVAQDAVSTGAAYIVDYDKHLYLWQGTDWQDCGLFRGDNGDSAYVHIAWANTLDQTDATTGKHYPSSFVIEKTADAAYEYMGIYTDNNACADSQDGSKYDWQAVKGADGETYKINVTNSIAKIPSDMSSATFSATFTFYKKVGGEDYKEYLAYGVAYRKAGSTYTHITHTTTKSTSLDVSNVEVTENVSAIVVCIYDEPVSSTTQHSGYLAECVVPVIKDGNNGNGILSVLVAYAISNVGATANDSTAPSVYGGWATTQPIPTPEHPYLWQRTKTTMTNSATTTRYNLIAVRGADGSALSIDMSNEMDAVALTNDGVVEYSTSLSTSVSVFNGSQSLQQTSDPTIEGDSFILNHHDVNMSQDGTKANIELIFDKGEPFPFDRCELTITIHTALRDMTATWTIVGVRAGAKGEPAVIYQLQPSVTQISQRKNGNKEPNVISCAVKKKTGTEWKDAPSSEYVLKRSVDGGGETNDAANTIFSTSSISSNITYILYDASGAKVMDRERVPLVIDGTDGDNSVSYSIQCADTVKTNTQSVSLLITRSDGKNIATQSLSAARDAWNVSIGRSITNITGDPRVNYATSTLDLSDTTLSTDSVITLYLVDAATNIVVATKVIRVVADGMQGKMGRNIYFAGKWDDADVAGKSFVATDYQAPYVDASHDNVTAFYVYVGDNGTYQFPTNYSSYQNSSVWTPMETSFKYMIGEAIFSTFAKLGSWIFNEDFMFSQQGVDGTTNYRNFNPNNPTTWMPNILLNAASGKAWLNDVEVRGKVTTTGMSVNQHEVNTTSTTIVTKAGTYTISQDLAANRGTIDLELDIDSFEVGDIITFVHPMANSAEYYDNLNTSGATLYDGIYLFYYSGSHGGAKMFQPSNCGGIYIQADSDIWGIGGLVPMMNSDKTVSAYGFYPTPSTSSGIKIYFSGGTLEMMVVLNEDGNKVFYVKSRQCMYLQAVMNQGLYMFPTVIESCGRVVACFTSNDTWAW